MEKGVKKMVKIGGIYMNPSRLHFYQSTIMPKSLEICFLCRTESNSKIQKVPHLRLRRKSRL